VGRGDRVLRSAASCNFKAEIIYLTGDDEHAIDVHRGWGEFEGIGRSITNWVLYYTVRNGLMEEVQSYDQHAADLFYWKVRHLKPLRERIATL